MELIKQKGRKKTIKLSPCGGGKFMRKDKSIVAMFCVAVVALIASLSVTFGVLLTAADTTPVAGKQIVYSFNMGHGLTTEGDVINVDNKANLMEINKTFTYQPKGTVEISADYLLEDYVVPGQTAEELVEFVHTDASNFMVIAFSVTNTTGYANFDLFLEFGEEVNAQLKGAAKMALYNYQEAMFAKGTYEDELSVNGTIALSPIAKGDTAYYALVLYVPESTGILLNNQAFDFTVRVQAN